MITLPTATTAAPTATATTTGTGTQQPPPPPPTFAVGGTIEGLEGSGMVISNGGDKLTLAPGAASFAFPTRAKDGAAFDVQVNTQPLTPTENCAVSSGSPGTIHGADANVKIVCTRVPFNVGGTVTGLTSGTITLRNKGIDDLVVSADGPFTFPAKVPSGSPYSVTISDTTGAAKCSVSAGSGTVGDGDVKGVLINCSADKAFLGGSVTSVLGTVTLQAGAGVVTVSSSGPFVFPTTYPIGSNYNVLVSKQPANQTCSVVAGGSGTISPTSGSAVKVTCTGGASAPHSVNVTVTGLVGWGDALTLRNNGGNPITVLQDGFYSFPAQDNLSTWDLSITNPSAPSQTCTADVTSGTIQGFDANVDVTCSAPTIGPWVAANAGWAGTPCYDGIVFQTTGVAAGCTDSVGVLTLTAGTWTNVSTGIDNLKLSAIAYMTGGGGNSILLGAQGTAGLRNIYRGGANNWLATTQSAEADVPGQVPAVAYSMYGARLVSAAGPMVSSWDPRDSGHGAILTNFTGGSGTGNGQGSPGVYTVYYVENSTGMARTLANVPNAAPSNFTFDPLDVGTPNTRDFVAVYGKNPSGQTAVGGVYFSGNAGHSWKDMTGNIPASDRPFIWTVRADPTTTTPAARTIYVGLRGGAKIYKSTNTGVTWTAFGTGIPSQAEVLTMFVSGATVYAGTNIGLWKLSGSTWTYVGFANKVVRAVASDGTNTFVGIEDGTGLYKPAP